jgi:amidase
LRLSAADLAKLIKAKEVLAKEVATAALARLDAVNPRINAVVDHNPADVLAQASAVDAAIARGEQLGELAGVPVTVKVNTDHEGFATTNGVKLERDTLAKSNSPVIDNLRKARAVILGRTNCSAFCHRWFTTNLLHGNTKNPRDPGITAGGSSGDAGAAVAAGIGHIAHGTDIAGSIRYPAYACGVHGLRPTVGRVPGFNAALPERTIGPQISQVSGPLARTIGDLRIALAAMSVRNYRDPWWVPAPLEGPPMQKRVAMCLNPDGLDPVPEVKTAIADAGKRLERAGWAVEEILTTPPLREAADLQTKLWFGADYEAQLEAAEREGDPGALACLRGIKPKVFPFDLSKVLTRRATLIRQWLELFETYAVLLMPVSGELPFPDNFDLKDDKSFARVWHALSPMIAIPFVGLPGLTITTGLAGRVPVGVQLVSGRYREDLCLAAGESIEAGGTPSAPIDPTS